MKELRFRGKTADQLSTKEVRELMEFANKEIGYWKSKSDKYCHPLNLLTHEPKANP